MNLSRSTRDHLRGQSVAWVAPLWEDVRLLTSPFPTPSEILLVENERLHTQCALLEEKLANAHQELDVRRAHPEAIPAQVVFRSLDSWDQALWINVGTETNRAVTLNSPVVIGQSLVGLIDCATARYARVCLVTDSHITPSVRVARGGAQDGCIAESIAYLKRELMRMKHVSMEKEETAQLHSLLEKLETELYPFKKTWLLAKGELRGGVRHKDRLIFQGTGFNYDFADKAGDSRELRTGRPLHMPNAPAIPILRLHDLLITTGMDGKFPPGLHVGVVSQIIPLKEGDYFYQIEAIPTAGDFDAISTVCVLPPYTPVEPEERKDLPFLLP